MKDLSIIKTSSTLPGIAAANSNEKSSFPPPPPPRGAKPKNKINNLRRFPSDSTLDSTMTDNTFCRGRKALENEFFDDGKYQRNDKKNTNQGPKWPKMAKNGQNGLKWQVLARQFY